MNNTNFSFFSFLFCWGDEAKKRTIIYSLFYYKKLYFMYWENGTKKNVFGKFVLYITHFWKVFKRNETENKMKKWNRKEWSYFEKYSIEMK